MSPSSEGNYDHSRVVLAAKFLCEGKDGGSCLLRVRGAACEVDDFIIGDDGSYPVRYRYSVRPFLACAAAGLVEWIKT
jgi:hypothetical protein